MVFKARDMEEFQRLRSLVAAAIKYEREVRHEPGKIYEGTWEITFEFPPQDEDAEAQMPPDWCKIRLHCYLIGPARHYEWTGDSFAQALERCRKDVKPWCEAVYREDDADEADD